jgi:hypothetical protein
MAINNPDCAVQNQKKTTGPDATALPDTPNKNVEIMVVVAVRSCYADRIRPPRVMALSTCLGLSIGYATTSSRQDHVCM